MEKIAEREKAFGKKTIQPTRETMFLSPKGKDQSHDSSVGDGNKRGHGRNKFRGRGVDITMVRDMTFTMPVVPRMDMRQIYRISWEKITEEEKNKEKCEAPKSIHFIVAH